MSDFEVDLSATVEMTMEGILCIRVMVLITDFGVLSWLDCLLNKSRFYPLSFRLER